MTSKTKTVFLACLFGVLFGVFGGLILSLFVNTSDRSRELDSQAKNPDEKVKTNRDENIFDGDLDIPQRSKAIIVSARRPRERKADDLEQERSGKESEESLWETNNRLLRETVERQESEKKSWELEKKSRELRDRKIEFTEKNLEDEKKSRKLRDLRIEILERILDE